MKFPFKCEICQRGPDNGVTIFRTGGKGPGLNPHWRCDADRDKAKTIDPAVETVVAIVESSNQPNKH